MLISRRYTCAQDERSHRRQQLTFEPRKVHLLYSIATADRLDDHFFRTVFPDQGFTLRGEAQAVVAECIRIIIINKKRSGAIDFLLTRRNELGSVLPFEALKYVRLQ